MDGLGEYIKARREYLGMSATELAAITGIPLAYLSQIESGSRKWPQKYISALADALGVPDFALAFYAGKISLDNRVMDSVIEEAEKTDPYHAERLREINRLLSPQLLMWLWESGGGDWYSLIKQDADRTHALPRRNRPSQDETPITEAELSELKNAIFDGLGDMSPAKLRKILEIVRSE